MLSLEKCRQILKNNNYGKNLADEELRMLRDFLLYAAQLNIEFLNYKEYEECDNLLSCK